MKVHAGQQRTRRGEDYCLLFFYLYTFTPTHFSAEDRGREEIGEERQGGSDEYERGRCRGSPVVGDRVKVKGTHVWAGIYAWLLARTKVVWQAGQLLAPCLA